MWHNRGSRKTSARAAAVRGGWRSGLEEDVASSLREKGVAFAYEALVIPFLPPSKPKRYTPDFLLLSNGVIVETKGRFVTADRQKHKLVKEQHPDIDIRFVFSNPNAKIAKKSKTTYAAWCDQYGFRYAAVRIPESWLAEPVNEKSLAAIQKLQKEKP